MMINKEKIKIYGLIGVIILILIGLAYFVGGRVGRASKQLEIDISRQNVAALSEQIEIIKGENGELIFSKNALVMSVEELERVNADLSNQIRASKNKVLSMNSIILQYEKNYSDLLNAFEANVKIVKLSGNLDTNSYCVENFLTDSADGLTWSLINNVNLSVGDSNKLLSFTNEIQNFKLNVKLFTGLEYDEATQLYKVTASCPNNSVKFDLDGWIDPNTFFKKEKNFSIGLHAGIGLGTDKHLNFTIPIFYVGFGISRNLISF